MKYMYIVMHNNIAVVVCVQVRQCDEEKLESRIQKLKDSLFTHDPHLAPLVKQDTTTTATAAAAVAGAADVEQDTETRQLMSVTIFSAPHIQVETLHDAAILCLSICLFHARISETVHF